MTTPPSFEDLKNCVRANIEMVAAGEAIQHVLEQHKLGVKIPAIGFDGLGPKDAYQDFTELSYKLFRLRSLLESVQSTKK